jgi:hypothetical protein
MSSTHHQMMYPYNMPKTAFELVAWSEYFLSDTYLNGGNEEMELPEEFLEPEIVYYPNRKALAIQGHPEYPGVEENTLTFCKKLIFNYLLDDKKSN